MLSIRAWLSTAARQVACSRHISLVVLSLLTICAQPGCTTSPAPSPPSVLPHSAPEPVSLGGIRVRLRPPAADGFATPTIVVYLAAERAQPVWQIPEQLVEIRRSGGGLSPVFIAVAVNQSLKFRVVDDIYHHIFSESNVGAFDLGSLGKGESKRVSFDKPGMLRLYCALHPSENATLYISPSTHFARIPASGEVVLGGLLPGRYQVHAWSESKPNSVTNVLVRSGAISRVEILKPEFGGGD